MKTVCKIDCGNSPKMEIIRDLNIAFGMGGVDFISKTVSENVFWNRVGYDPIHGMNELISSIKQLSKTKILILDIHNIFTHGKFGYAEGRMTLGDSTILGYSNI